MQNKPGGYREKPCSYHKNPFLDMKKQIPITNIFGNNFLRNRPYERKRPKYLDDYEVDELLNADVEVDSIQPESNFENDPILHFDSDSNSDLDSESDLGLKLFYIY